jgi:uncharacterized protein with PIN domain
MPADNTDLKARMMGEVEKVIERLLTERSAKEELTLSDIERLVRAAGQEVMRGFTGELVEEEAQKAQGRTCPECGQEMRYKGKKRRDLATETGEVRLERAYYYCPICRKGVFPPRPTVGDQ